MLGVIELGMTSRIHEALLIISSLACAILGGTLFAIFMILALVGGILMTIGEGKKKAPQVNTSTEQ
jgi:hypothetical protein